MLWSNIPFLLVIILGFSSLLGPIWTFSREPKNLAYFLLVLLGIIAGPVWAVSTTAFLSAVTLESASFWTIIIYLSSIFIGLFHFLFSVYYLRKKSPNVFVTLFVVVGYIFFFYEIVFTNSFIVNIGLGETGNSIQLGRDYLFWMFWLVVVFSVNIYNTLSRYKELSFVEREQHKYLIIGNVVTVVGSLPANIIAPYFGVFDYIWFGPVVFSIANVIISYGLTQTRFQRLSKIVRSIFRIFALYFLPSVAVVFVMEYVFSLSTEFPFSKAIFYIVVIILFALFLRFFEGTVAKVFLSEKQILRSKGEMFIELLNFEQELSEICNKTLKYICRNTPAKEAQIFLYDTINTKSYHFKEGEWEIQSLRKIFLEIPRYWNLQKNKFKPLVRSEFEYLKNRDPLFYKEFSGLLDLLKMSMVQIVYPVISGNELVGVLFIKDSSGDQIYKVEELNLWDTIYSQFHISVNKALLYQQLQSFNATLQQKVDIQTSELQTKIRELEEARRKENDMIDIMGHELRTPATIVKLNADFLTKFVDEVKSDPQGYKKYVKRIQDAIENEIKLINTLLNSAKLEGDKIELNPEEIDIRKEIEMSLHGSEGEAKEKGLTLINNTDSSTPSVYADHARVVEVLNNLVSNAIKYTQVGGVAVNTRFNDNFVQISVTDTGKGIPKDDLSKLGQKFYRVSTYINSEDGDHTEIVRPGGTGLGLYVAFNLVRKMGGDIAVNSEVGKGSTFSFTLPRYKGEISTKVKGSANMFERLGLSK